MGSKHGGQVWKKTLENWVKCYYRGGYKHGHFDTLSDASRQGFLRSVNISFTVPLKPLELKKQVTVFCVWSIEASAPLLLTVGSLETQPKHIQ